MRVAVTFLLLAATCAAEDLPITGISHVNFRVSNLEKAQAFYTGVLGLPMAFSTGRNGAIGTAYLKVNDDQYIEFSPGLPAGVDLRLTHVAFVTTDIEKLHAALTERGLNPTPLRPPGGDGTRGLRIADPFGYPLEFTEYLPGSEHAKARGKFEDPKRISVRLLHAGIAVPREKLDIALAYYRDKLGLTEVGRGDDWIDLRIPGTRGDIIELVVYSGTPSREELGTMQHVALQVQDIQKAYRTVVDRGADAEKSKPRMGRIDLYDADGSRTELVQHDRRQ